MYPELRSRWTLATCNIAFFEIFDEKGMQLRESNILPMGWRGSRVIKQSKKWNGGTSLTNE
jgi:hypothetical protein